jgi:hypothetical protein
MKTFQRLTLTAILAASALLVTGCGGNGAASAAPATSATDAVASPEQSSSPSATPTVATPSLAAGIVAKGVANDGKGEYLQTSIADTDPAMKYDPALADAATKANFSEADIAEAQKTVVKFIAEEAIDSTLNGGGTDVDGWWAAHKDQIHPLNQEIMLNDLKSDKDILARERWIASKPDYSYAHGATTPRVVARTITPVALRYAESDTLQGIMIETTASYEMAVKKGELSSVQSSTAELSFAVAKDPADGKWKIAGYDTNYHTAEG